MEQFLEIAKDFSLPGALVVVTILIYKTGIFHAFAKKMLNGSDFKNSNGINKRTTELEKFQRHTEENHFHSIENIKEDMKEMKNDINQIYNRLNQNTTDIAVLKSKSNGKGNN